MTATGTVAATGMLLSSSVLENRRLLGGKQTVFSRVNFGGLPADEPDCGVDVEAALSISTYIQYKCNYTHVKDDNSLH